MTGIFSVFTDEPITFLSFLDSYYSNNITDSRDGGSIGGGLCVWLVVSSCKSGTILKYRLPIKNQMLNSVF